MQTENQSDNGTKKKKSRIYFTIGAISLVVMALFWSVDSSIVYIFLGAASFFLFLGFYSNPAEKNPYREQKWSYRQQEKVVEIKPSLLEELKAFFQQKHGSPKQALASPNAVRNIIRLVSFVIFLFIFIPILVSLFSSGGGSYDAINYYTAAENQYFSQEYDSAYMNYRRAMQLDPEYEEAIVGYGNVLAIRNESDSAIKMYDKALEINPSYKEAAYNKSLALYNQKKYNDAIPLLTTLIEENPDYYDAVLLLGDCYYIQTKYDDAIPWYENAYQNGGIRSRMLCHVMAFIYDTKGEYDKAITLYKEALSYDSSVVDIYQRLGELITSDDGNFYRTKAIQMKQ